MVSIESRFYCGIYNSSPDVVVSSSFSFLVVASRDGLQGNGRAKYAQLNDNCENAYKIKFKWLTPHAADPLLALT